MLARRVRLRQDPRLFGDGRRAAAARSWSAPRPTSPQGLRGLILDLRRNPGGLLDQGVKVADRFLDNGLIVKTVGKARHA